MRPSTVLAKITEEEILKAFPVKIKFGRPDFATLVEENIHMFEKNCHVYACKSEFSV